MAWLYLTAAGLFEVAWLLTMRFSEGFTRFWPTVLTVGLMGGSFFMLSFSLKGIPMGTAYAVWTGIGAVGAALAGVVLFDESRDIWRMLSIAMIVAGLVGLKLTASN